jgi:glyoxylate utilization-related uncharacterized protein
MKTNDTSSTTSSPSPWLIDRKILNEAGLEGLFSLVGPATEKAPETAGQGLVLFVSEGCVTVAVGPTHYILRQEEMLHIAPGKIWGLRNNDARPAKVLRLTLPPVRSESGLRSPTFV